MIRIWYVGLLCRAPLVGVGVLKHQLLLLGRRDGGGGSADATASVCKLELLLSEQQQHAVVLKAQAFVVQLHALHLALLVGAEAEPFEVLAL